jgi:hypothetical protein
MSAEAGAVIVTGIVIILAIALGALLLAALIDKEH